MARATAVNRTVTGVFGPGGMILLAILLILLSMAPIASNDGPIYTPLLCVLGILVALGGLFFAATRASWIGPVTETRVVLRKPPILIFMHLLWAALVIIGYVGETKVAGAPMLRAHHDLISMLFKGFIVLGFVGILFLPQAVPTTLICNPQTHRFVYRVGIFPMRTSHEGQLYDMLGLRVDEEKNRYIIRVVWRSKRWKIIAGSSGNMEKANEIGRRLTKAIGTSFWPAN